MASLPADRSALVGASGHPLDAIVQPDVWKLMRAEITHPGDSI